MNNQMLDAIRESRKAKALVDTIVTNIYWRETFGYVWYNDPEKAKQEDIDYLAERRLDAILKQQEVDRLEAIELQKQQDWLDDQQMYSQLRNGG